jgi:hypothetical protein
MAYNFRFDDALTWFTLPLFIAAFLMICWIVHEVLPYLNEEERVRIREWYRSGGHGRINKTLNRAWSEHYRLFPRSRKRVLFACLLIAASLSVLAYPLWLGLGHR